MDIAYLLWLQELRNATGGVLDSFFETISWLVISTYAYLLMVAIYWCMDKKAGTMMAMNIGFGNVANQTLKNIFCVYRPWIRDSRIVPVGDSMTGATGYSFPSGHTQCATTEFGTIVVWQRKRKWISILCVIVVLLVMFSRNYLGVHTPQDVIVSCALCSLVIFLDYRLMHWVEEKQNRDLIVFMSGIVVCIVFLLFITLKPYPLDYAADGSVLVDPVKMMEDCYKAAGCALGFLSGWLLEKRFIKFEPMKKIWQKILCFIVGAVLLLLLVKFVCDPLVATVTATGEMGGCLGKLLNTFILYMYIMAGFPCLIKIAETKWMR